MKASELAGWLQQTLPEVLPAFLPARRWFAGKGRPIASVTFEDAAWLPGEPPSALVVVQVRDDRGDEATYALVVAFVHDAGARPVIARVETASGTAWAVEATSERHGALALLRGFASDGKRRLPMLHGGTLLYRDSGEAAARVLDAVPQIQPVGAEQSNTSLNIDRALAFKLFRRVESGENPELEIGRFLATRTSFRALPLLRGSLTYLNADHQAATIGVLQDWIDSRGDGWDHLGHLLRRQDDESINALRDDAFALGVATERLHRALATGHGEAAFAPEPATADDVARWRQHLSERSQRSMALIRQQMTSWPPSTRRLATSLVERQAGLLALPGVPDAGQHPFQKIRVHGDYHLGQVLRAADRFVVIDFEGEPAKSLAERRAKQPAMRDVAGMLRSFDYASEAVPADAPPRGDGYPLAQMLRERFLDGYHATFADTPPAFAPADPIAARAWTDFFELEKAFYELEYEINNRPAWVHIPLKGLLRIVGGHTTGEHGHA